MNISHTDPEKNKAIIRRFVDEVQTQQRWDVYDELVHPDFFDHSGLPGKTDKEGSKQNLANLLNGFPDGTFTVDDMIAEGDEVATKKTLRGTHTAEMGGIPPTGRQVTLQYADIMRIRDGQISEHWLAMDQLSFLQQLGVIPPPE